MAHFSEINFRDKDPRIDVDKEEIKNNMNSRMTNRDLMDIQIQRDLTNFNKRIHMERNDFMIQSRNRKTDLFDKPPENDDDDDVYKPNKYIESMQSSESGIHPPERGIHPPERGMPFRPEYDLRKDPRESQQSEHPSFILRKTNGISKLSANDSLQSGYASFPSIDEPTRFLSQLSDDKQVLINLNEFSINLLKNLIGIINSPFIISTFDMYTLFAGLYASASGNTEIELKNYFNFPKSNQLILGLNKIKLEIKNTNVKFGSCFLFDNQLSFNEDFYSSLSKFLTMRKINLNAISNEVDRTNSIIAQFTSHHMKKTITKVNIENLSSLGIIFGYINPCLLINNYNIKNGSFKSQYLGLSNIQYIEAYNQRFGFIEKDNFCILEIALDGLNEFFGIIQLNSNQSMFDRKDILNGIANLKPIYFKKIMFPLFSIQTKMKLKNILKAQDLKTIFLDLNIPELFSDQLKLDEILVNLEIKLEPKFKTINDESNVNKSDREFIVEKTFIFYFRNIKNIILNFGIF